MHYLIRTNVEPLGTGEVVPPDRIIARINELSGRPIAHYVLHKRQIGTSNRVYVATGKDSPGRQLHGKGFIVERVA